MKVSEQELQQITNELFPQVVEFWGVKQNVKHPPIEVRIYLQDAEAGFSVKENKIFVRESQLNNIKRLKASLAEEFTHVIRTQIKGYKSETDEEKKAEEFLGRIAHSFFATKFGIPYKELKEESERLYKIHERREKWRYINPRKLRNELERVYQQIEHLNPSNIEELEYVAERLDDLSLKSPIKISKKLKINAEYFLGCFYVLKEGMERRHSKNNLERALKDFKKSAEYNIKNTIEGISSDEFFPTHHSKTEYEFSIERKGMITHASPYKLADLILPYIEKGKIDKTKLFYSDANDIARNFLEYKNKKQYLSHSTIIIFLAIGIASLFYIFKPQITSAFTLTNFSSSILILGIISILVIVLIFFRKRK